MAARMRALLAHSGPMVHVNHAQRMAAPTGMAWAKASDGSVHRVFEKGERVYYIDRNNNALPARVTYVGPPMPETLGMPSGYQVEVFADKDTSYVADTVAERLRPQQNPNANSAPRGGYKYRLVVRMCKH